MESGNPDVVDIGFGRKWMRLSGECLRKGGGRLFYSRKQGKAKVKNRVKKKDANGKKRNYA